MTTLFTRRLFNGHLSGRRNGCVSGLARLSPGWALQRRGLLTTTLSDPGLLSVIPANLMSEAYLLGFPWLIAIPLSAVLIRSVIVYPLFLSPRRRALAKLSALRPLLEAQTSQRLLDHTWKRSKGNRGILARLGQRSNPAMLRIWLILEKRRLRKRMEERYRARTRPIWYALAPILVLITASEGLRRLCGQREGLLPKLFGPFQQFFVAVWQGTRNIFSRSAADQRSALVTDDYVLTSGVTHAVDSSDQRFQRFNVSDWQQDSLRTAGPGWCPDLTTPDETKLLPAVFSGLFIAFAWFTPKDTSPQSSKIKVKPTRQIKEDIDREGYNASFTTLSLEPEAGAPRRTVWQKLVIGIACLSFIPAMQLPPAMLIYFIANLLTARAHGAYLARRMPMIMTPKVCSIPPRMDRIRLPATPVTSTQAQKVNIEERARVDHMQANALRVAKHGA